jgi:hypothetical protein
MVLFLSFTCDTIQKPCKGNKKMSNKIVTYCKTLRANDVDFCAERYVKDQLVEFAPDTIEMFHLQ